MASSRGDEQTGMNILRVALEVPTRQIAENSDADDGVVVDRMRRESGAIGFDASRGEYGDLVQLGIVDATKVARVALEDAELYGGRARGVVTLDDTGQAPVVGANLALEGISALPLLEGALGFGWLEGAGTITLALAGQGSSERQIVETLNGKVALAVSNGAVNGINLPRLLREIERPSPFGMILVAVAIKT